MPRLSHRRSAPEASEDQKPKGSKIVNPTRRLDLHELEQQIQALKKQNQIISATAEKHEQKLRRYRRNYKVESGKPQGLTVNSRDMSPGAVRL